MVIFDFDKNGLGEIEEILRVAHFFLPSKLSVILWNGPRVSLLLRAIGLRWARDLQLPGLFFRGVLLYRWGLALQLPRLSLICSDPKEFTIIFERSSLGAVALAGDEAFGIVGWLCCKLRAGWGWQDWFLLGFVVSATRQSQAVRQALQLMRQLHASRLRANSVALSAAASACTRAGRWEEALSGPLRQLSDSSLQRDVIAWNAAIGAHSAGQSWAGALAVLRNMRLGRQQPTSASFNTALGACREDGQWPRAVALFGLTLRQHGLRADLIGACTAISACEGAGQWRSAIGLLYWLTESSLRPQVLAFNAAISACAKGGQTVRALGLLADLRLSGLEPDTLSCNAVVSACAAGARVILSKGGPRGWEAALVLLRDMSRWGPQPSVVTYNVAISACGAGGCWERALDLLESLQTSCLQGFRGAHIVSFGSAMNACRTAGDSASQSI
ncbi:unnamed protein product [Polarella glacialis]|uniref:Pentatricopeptide repeat-containing protein, chloroplastic n=1 Tax=Polarella glacialis TaxID=89957 RepID=A0A813JYQ8_POLGL|nr:unnamed protein product [Polarella glacialis]